MHMETHWHSDEGKSGREHEPRFVVWELMMEAVKEEMGAVHPSAKCAML